MTDYKDIFNARGHLYNEASSKCPEAREAERAALIHLLDIKSGQTIVDVPAGGGYLADGIQERFDDSISVICVEPAERFASAINPHFRVILEAADKISSLGDNSVDTVASLAGLHHIEDKRPVYREWARILRPGGRVAIADVATNTGTADFLNIFVDEFVPGGHDGRFFAEGEWSDQLATCGFVRIQEKLCSVPWNYDNKTQMIDFCWNLFGVQKATTDQVGKALHQYVGVEATDKGGVQLMWQLRYVTAQLPTDQSSSSGANSEVKF